MQAAARSTGLELPRPPGSPRIGSQSRQVAWRGHRTDWNCTPYAAVAVPHFAAYDLSSRRCNRIKASILGRVQSSTRATAAWVQVQTTYRSPQMQVTVDTRHDTLEEALAVIRLAFAHGKELGAAVGSVEATGPVRRRTGGGSGSRRGGSRRAATARNDAATVSATQGGSANQVGSPAAVVEDRAPGRARAAARKAATKKSAARKGDTTKPPARKARVPKSRAQNVASTKAASKVAPMPASATKRAPASRSAASRHDGRSNTAPPGQADVVRAWARAQGMQVKAAGRMPAAVISAYYAAHS